MDVEKARLLLASITTHPNNGSEYARKVTHLAETALAALDGEASPEVWEVQECVDATWVLNASGDGIAKCHRAEDARRITDDHNRMAKLEKAAQAVVAQYNNRPFPAFEFSAAIGNLHAALAQED